MPRRIALIVGVSQYEPHTKLGNLSAPINDAQRVYDVLSEYGGFDMLYPLPLADGKVGSSGKVNAQTLREELRKILNPQASEEVELAVFYFSGHGVSHHGMASYLSATDDPLAVPLSFIIELVENSTVKNVCVWLDCCHSGEVLKFKTSEKKSFCIVAASTADEEALARKGHSLLTEILCEALTPDQDRPEIRVLEFVDYLEAHRKNLPQQILFRGDTPFTLTQYHGEVSVKSPYPPEHPPYKGLLTFTQVDREFFFGRDGMIQQLLDRLSANRFVPLLGASGSGKSSLVLAGLLPQLPESDWQVLVMRPTAQPLQKLHNELVLGFSDTQVGTLASSSDLHREVLRLVTAGKRLLLVVDQFEEVFTECRDDVARATFIACLLEALDSDNPLHLVLTLRADFLGHCTEQAYAGLGQRLQHHALLLVAPTASELREAISRPLMLVGMRCEQALEDELVDQTLHAKGSLPLLQYVLEKLWQSARQERSRELTLAMYQQLGGQHGGGLRGVLNEKADAFYQQLEPQQQHLMDWLMVELVQVNDGQEDTRSTVTLQELYHRQPQYTAALDALLAQLVTHERLLTQDHGDQGQATITVAHEALIRDWRRLRGWLESNREIKSWRRHLDDSITAWKNGVSGSLLREKRLAEAQQIIDRNPNTLLIGHDEKAFIVASQTEEKQYKKAKKQVFVMIMVLLCIGVFITTWQWQKTKQQQYEINQKNRTSLLNKLINDSAFILKSPTYLNGEDVGILLAIQVFRLNPDSPSAKSALMSIFNSEILSKSELHFNSIRKGSQKSLLIKSWLGHESGINSISFSPDSTFMISSGGDKTLRKWKLNNAQSIGEQWQGYNGNIFATAFSPDGRYVVSGDLDGTIRLWNATTGQPIDKPWQGDSYAIQHIAFSSDGKSIISTDSYDNIKIWDTKSYMNIKNMSFQFDGGASDDENYGTVALSPDGKLIIGTNDRTFPSLFNLEDEKIIKKDFSAGRAYRAEFSPDSQYIIVFDDDGYFWMEDVTSKNYSGILLPLNNYADMEDIMHPIMSIRQDNQYVVIASKNRIWFWSVENQKPLANPWQTQSEITVLAFSPNGKIVVSGGADGILSLWDADPESWAKKACSIVNRNFSLAEWQRFIGDALPYQKTCPDLPAPGEDGWVEPYAGG